MKVNIQYVTKLQQRACSVCGYQPAYEVLTVLTLDGIFIGDREVLSYSFNRQSLTEGFHGFFQSGESYVGIVTQYGPLYCSYTSINSNPYSFYVY